MHTMRIVAIAASLVALVGCGSSEVAPHPALPPRLADIPIGESVSLSVHVSGCYAESVHRFRFTSGERFTVEISAILTDLLPAGDAETETTSQSGLVSLSREDVARVDKALSHYRRASPSVHYRRNMQFKIEWPQGDELLQVDGETHQLMASNDVLPLLALPGMAIYEDGR